MAKFLGLLLIVCAFCAIFGGAPKWIIAIPFIILPCAAAFARGLGK
jgi:hypothetical protein